MAMLAYYILSKIYIYIYIYIYMHISYDVIVNPAYDYNHNYIVQIVQIIIIRIAQSYNSLGHM